MESIHKLTNGIKLIFITFAVIIQSEAFMHPESLYRKVNGILRYAIPSFYDDMSNVLNLHKTATGWNYG